MKISLIEHQSPPIDKMSFTDVIKFSIVVDPYDKEHEMHKDAEQKLKELCAWCCETFKDNFIIMEHVSARIAGGYMDNARGWKQEGGRVKRKDYAWQAKYELRCMSADATWFKMRTA